MLNITLLRIDWRFLLMISLITGASFMALVANPIPLDPAGLQLADMRMLIIGIPNTLDVMTNLAFLLVGLIGLSQLTQRSPGSAQRSWLIFFISLILTGFGSACFHIAPSSQTLLWEHLPMAIGFMGLFVGLLTDFVDENLEGFLLVPAMLLGLFSVFYGHLNDDLRFYIWVQYVPLLLMLFTALMYRYRFTHNLWMEIALLLFLAARLFQQYDQSIYKLTDHLISGHTLQHLLSALSCFVLLEYFRKRRIIPQQTTENDTAASECQTMQYRSQSRNPDLRSNQPLSAMPFFHRK